MSLNDADPVKDPQRKREDGSIGVTPDGKFARRVWVAGSDGDEQSTLKEFPLVTNVNAINNSTEYSHTFQDECKGFILQSRTVTRIKVAWQVGGTSTNYFTIGLGGAYREDRVFLPTGSTIYFQCENNNRVVEIIEWT